MDQWLAVTRFRAKERPDLMAMNWRLRHQVFHDELCWNVRSLNGIELDDFDLAATHCAVVLGDIVVGCWRAMSTAGPYMLQQVFPELLPPPLPKSHHVWEISRFAVMPDLAVRKEVGRLLVREAVALGRDFGASRLLAVTDPAFERFVRSCGLAINRIGGPMVVGTGRRGPVKAVVITCGLDPQTLAGVGLEARAA